MKSIAFIYTHPIQYFSPLLATLAKELQLNLEVFYLSDETLNGSLDLEFDTHVKWNIPLLDGYEFSFVRNDSWKPSFTAGFFGLINFQLLRHLRRLDKGSVIVIHGWAFFSNFYAVYVAKLLGHRVFLRAETPLKQETRSLILKKILRTLLLKWALFPFIDRFLYIGVQNRMFYQKWRVPDRKLTFTPYAVDNERFANAYRDRFGRKRSLRDRLQIPTASPVVLFVGKYLPKKRPLDLLKAIATLGLKADLYGILVGEGPLRGEMERFVNDNQLSRKVRFTGFINQHEISDYYSVADIFVMCSEQGETWGLAVNEAMNFHLPIVASDLTGCTDDLVRNGNGLVYKTGDIQALVDALLSIISLSPEERVEMGNRSALIVRNYSFRVIAENLAEVL